MKVIIDDTYKNRPTRIYENESPCLRAERQIKVAEDCVEYGKLGGGKWNKIHDISRRVYSPDGVSPTIHTAQGDHTEPKVIEHMILDEQNGYIRQDGCVGTLTTDGSSPKHNNRVIEKTIVAQRGRNPDNPSNRNKGIHLEQRFEENTEGLANTLSTVQKDNYVCEKGIEVVGNYSPSGHDASRIVSTDGLASTVKENHGTVTAIQEPSPWVSAKGNKYITDPKRGMCTDINADICQPLTASGQKNWTGSFVSPDIECLEKNTEIGTREPTKIKLKNGETITSDDDISWVRIRKLTPRECFRLMGFDDIDFDRAAAVNSNSQLYKQAGNSIVVNVLEEIFQNLFL